SARHRVDADFAKNRIRIHGIEELYRSLHHRLHAAGLEFVALKGLTHAALFRPGSEQVRMQYDVDLYLPREAAERAQQHLSGAGGEPPKGREPSPPAHPPALTRRPGWQGRGDFFAREIPLSVELPFQFWNDRRERRPAPGTPEFWSRRTTRPLAGVELGV